MYRQKRLVIVQCIIDLIPLCGFSIGIMWPGSIGISSQILPKGGTAMFALLALAGDLSGAIGPAIIGNVSQKAANNLRAEVLAGIGFPIYS